MRMPGPRPFALLAVAAALGGCNPFHSARQPDDVELTRTPDAWRQPVGEAALADRWWSTFDDPGLERLIGRLLTDNLDLVQAWSRLDQSRAVAAAQGAARLPSVNLSATAGASRRYATTVEPTGDPMNPLAARTAGDTFESYGLSAAAQYEVDLWDRVGATHRAARLDVQASALDVQALAISLTARAADLWFALVEQRATQALLESQIETNETLLDLARFRFGEGLAAAADVLQQEQLLLSTRRQLPSVLARRATLEHQLAVLLGQPPAAGHGLGGDGAALPDPPALPAVGLPADLLRRRPDIRAAQARVAAADERIGAAIAGRLPNITLSASVGFEAQSLSDLIDRWVWSLAGNLLAPLFDGGRRAAEVERTRAAVEGALAAFTQTALSAFAEVEDALALEAAQAETLQRIEAELTVSRRLYEQARARYAEGLTDYLPVLSALQGMQRTELSLIAARRQRLAYRIQLHRALGGAWVAELAPATTTDSTRATDAAGAPPNPNENPDQGDAR